MEPLTLTGDQVRAVIMASASGANITQRTTRLAFTLQASKDTLYRYMKCGSRTGPLNVLLVSLAYKCEVLPTNATESVATQE